MIWACVMVQSAGAEVPGQTDPAFLTAFSTWLDSREADALPALSQLATAGNGAAQLVLGMIDSTPVLQGDWLMAQDRADRIALMRPAGGLSGGSWLREAAATDPLAATWLRLWDQAATPAIVVDFAVLNEPRAARVAALALAARQVHGFAAVAGQAGYPAVVQAYAILEDQRDAPGRAAAALAALAPGDPQGVFFGQRADAATAGWLASHAEGDPLLAFCAARCPAEPAAVCLAAAFEAVGGYHGLMRLGSPFESIVASDHFNRSAEGLEVTQRRMHQRQLALGLPLPPQGSTCLADLLN